ncbi:MAG TPA: helix-turn-helix transcriptional regulator [Nitriliruptorales bacterium]
MAKRGVRGYDPEALRRARETKRERTGAKPGEWTQEHVAELMGVARTNYMAWERTEGTTRTPTPATIKRLAELLDVTPEELTTVTPDEATLADLRSWAGLTQADVAAGLAVSRPTYAMIERGERELTRDQVRRFAHLVGRSQKLVDQAHRRGRG